MKLLNTKLTAANLKLLISEAQVATAISYGTFRDRKPRICVGRLLNIYLTKHCRRR